MWCCHNPYPGCYANRADAAKHCKATKQSPDVTKCGEYIYCCDEKCPEGTGGKPSGENNTLNSLLFSSPLRPHFTPLRVHVYSVPSACACFSTADKVEFLRCETLRKTRKDGGGGDLRNPIILTPECHGPPNSLLYTHTPHANASCPIF